MSRTLGDTFREEAQELLGELEIALIELEESPRDRDAVGRVFRALHTLKGSGSMAGFETVSELVHDVESVFELVRSGELPVSRELVSLTLAVRDRLKELIAAGPEGCPSSAEGRLLEEAVRAFLPLRDGGDAAVRALPAAPSDAVTFRIRFRPPTDVFRRGLNPVSLLRELDGLGDCRVVAQIDAIPPLAELDPELCYLYWDIILTTTAGENAIRDVFIFVEDDSELRIEVIDGGLGDGAGTDTGKLGEILVERGDLSLADLQAILAERKRLGEVLVERRLVDGGKIDAALAEQERVRRLRQDRQAAEAATTMRVRSEKLDALVDLVGELVTVQARLSQVAARQDDADLTAVAEDVERLTWEMRDQVLNIRMLPIGSTFSKFRRLVRDLSAELGRDVELVTEGADTELDKTVIERLYDPLVHLIRNGIDHGIEPPEDRRASGKPPRGRIRLSASHSGPNVLIRVGDDGRGLDLEALRGRAVAQGVLAPGAELSDKETLALAFLPGLSTSASVTSVSGRGVGMDVVKQAIEELCGSIEIDSRSGEGTVFSLKLPLTLAIIDGLLVQVGNDRFVMPLASVEECIELTRDQEARAHGRNLVSLRGEIIPYIRLRETFQSAGTPPTIEQVVIARLEEQRIGFVVDHVVGEHQTVIKALGRMYREVRGFSGATVLGDGQVALVLDLPQMLKVEESLAGFVSY